MNIFAVDVEAGVRPRKQPLCPIRAEKLPADEKGRRLEGEDLGQTRVVDPRNLMEDARRVHSAFSHQKMEVHVDPKILLLQCRQPLPGILPLRFHQLSKRRKITERIKVRFLDD